MLLPITSKPTRHALGGRLSGLSLPEKAARRPDIQEERANQTRLNRLAVDTC